MARHSVGRVVATVAFLGLVASACDSGGETSAPTSSSSSSTSTTTAPTTTTTVPCGPGGRTIVLEGVEVREFCGPARAEVTMGEDAVLDFEGGECSRHEEWLSVNLGVEVIEPEAGDEVAQPRFRSFSLLMGRHPAAAEDAPAVGSDGVHQAGSLTFTEPGTSWLVDDKTITLVGTRTAGTIVGNAITAAGSDEPVEVSAVFTCDEEAIALDEVTDLVDTETENDT